MKTLIITIFSLSFFYHANGTEINWIGTGSPGDWNDPLNWDLGRIPLASDSVLTTYGDDIIIPSGIVARCLYFRLLGDLEVENNATLRINNGMFNALGDVDNYGTIRISNSPDEGIYFTTQAVDVAFNNYGKIFIDNSTLHGLWIRFDQVFTNHPDAVIEITSTNGTTLEIDGTLNNSGIMRVGASVTGPSLRIVEADASLNNFQCSKISLLGQADLQSGILENFGFFKQNYDGDNEVDAGFVLNNYGSLEDIHNSFVTLDFDNLGIHINPIEFFAPRTGEPTVILNTDFPSGYTFSDVYTESDLSNLAGMYDASNNIWTPNEMANGKDMFFLEVSYISGCKDTVRFDLDKPVERVVYWTGGQGSWQFGLNWSTGSVPTANDTIVSYYETDSITIPFNYDAFGEKLELNGGDLHISILGSLTIDGAIDECLLMENGELIVGGTLNLKNSDRGIDARSTIITNNGQILCENIAECIYLIDLLASSPAFVNNGTISNDAGDLLNTNTANFINTGEINVNLPNGNGFFGTDITNEGTITLLGNGSNTGFSGYLSNAAGGSVIAENLETGLRIEGDNNGLIKVQDCITGIEFDDDFMNNSVGSIDVSNCSDGVSHVGGRFSNLEGATLTAKSSMINGIVINSTVVEFVNEGIIDIDTTNGTGILSSENLINQGNGKITVSNSMQNGIVLDGFNADLVNKNKAEIVVNKVGTHGFFTTGSPLPIQIDLQDQSSFSIYNVGNTGVLLEGGSLNLTEKAIMRIDSCDIHGLRLSSFSENLNTTHSDVSNSGRIYLGKEIVGHALHVESGSNYTNEKCNGVTENWGIIRNAGTLRNDGMFKQQALVSHNLSKEIRNFGIINDPFGTLTPGDIIDIGYYVGLVTGSYLEMEEIIGIIGIDANASTSVGFEANWYLDAELTDSGGEYNSSTNTFFAYGIAIDSSSFYLRSIDQACTSNRIDTLHLQLQNSIVKSCGSITWNGGTGSFEDWEKWSNYRLPTLCDSAVISSTLDSVLIDSDLQEINHLTNQGFVGIANNSLLRIENSPAVGITNQGEIDIRGTVRIQNTGGPAIRAFPGSEIHVKGALEVMADGLNLQIEDKISRNKDILYPLTQKND